MLGIGNLFQLSKPVSSGSEPTNSSGSSSSVLDHEYFSTDEMLNCHSAMLCMTDTTPCQQSEIEETQTTPLFSVPVMKAATKHKN